MNKVCVLGCRSKSDQSLYYYKIFWNTLPPHHQNSCNVTNYIINYTVSMVDGSKNVTENMTISTNNCNLSYNSSGNYLYTFEYIYVTNSSISMTPNLPLNMFMVAAANYKGTSNDSKGKRILLLTVCQFYLFIYNNNKLDFETNCHSVDFNTKCDVVPSVTSTSIVSMLSLYPSHFTLSTVTASQSILNKTSLSSILKSQPFPGSGILNKNLYTLSYIIM